jgi:hypothetical protein
LVVPVIEDGEPIKAWIIDDTSYPKQGNHSVGVQIAALRGVPAKSPFAYAIAEIIDAWALTTGTVYAEESPQETVTAQPAPRWLKFLLAFDVDYRKRRLHFMIEGPCGYSSVATQPSRHRGRRLPQIGRLRWLLVTIRLLRRNLRRCA